MAKAKSRVLGIDTLNQNLRALIGMAQRKDIIAAQREGAKIILEAAKANIRANFENQTGALENSGKIEDKGLFETEIIFDIVYSAVHEYGLENQVITERQRRFFWAMYSQTGEDMWKALALSRTYTIPARPYLRPAIDAEQKYAAGAMATELRRRMIKTIR